MTDASQPGTLYLIPNLLGQVSPDRVLPARTLEVIRRLSDFVVETPKLARRFLRTAGHPRRISDLRLAVFDEHTRPADVEPLLLPALAGDDIGLLSDAGCPAVADPGAKLVALAHARGVRVVPLVGPSAILLGLMASGLDGQGFTFHGYLPVPNAVREEALRDLERDARSTGRTQIFIETPYRNVALLAAACRVLAPDTLVCVAADLTADSEEVRCQPVRKWRLESGARWDRRPALFLVGCDRADRAAQVAM